MNVILLSTAAILGLLAFFEPCTIATHALFAVRTSRQPAVQRWRILAELMLTRILLLAILLGGAAAIGWASLTVNIVIGMLGGIGLVYLITRKIYLPVPYLACYRLFPGHMSWSQAYRLGLTLPACALPLVLIVGVLAASIQRLDMATAAAMAFAVMFTLPTLWESTHPYTDAHRDFLDRAARISPYLTALMLWGAAYFIWLTGV